MVRDNELVCTTCLKYQFATKTKRKTIKEQQSLLSLLQRSFIFSYTITTHFLN
jgi:hypothetical protein